MAALQDKSRLGHGLDGRVGHKRRGLAPPFLPKQQLERSDLRLSRINGQNRDHASFARGFVANWYLINFQPGPFCRTLCRAPPMNSALAYHVELGVSMGQSDEGRAEHDPRPLVTLVSTHTRDRVPQGSGLEPLEMPGGPAYYVALALDRLQCPFRLITGQVAIVDVVPGPEGEQYVIPPIEPIPLPALIEGDAVILSPIIREINPESVPPAQGILVVDLQGFVREPSKPSGAATGPFQLSNLLKRATIVKGSDRELALLDTESRAQLETSILIVTRGRRGSLIRHDGQEHAVAADAVPVSNTIGAGDTYLAGFVYAYLRGASPAEAARDAARFTEEFLRERLK